MNPHGQNIPPAGSLPTCIPGAKTAPNAGENPDGFFLVGTTDGTPGAACGSGDSPVTLFDCQSVVFDETTNTFVCNEPLANLFSFGTFANGTTVKYIEANGATPSVNPMGSNNSPTGNGQAGAVDFRINGTGDLLVCSPVTGTCTLCLVPPPPK